MPGCADHEVHVCRAEGMPAKALQKLTRRSVVGDRVADREDGPELVLATLVSLERRPEMAAWLVFVLNVVQLVCRRLPDLDRGTGYGLAVCVRDAALHNQRLAVLLSQQDRVALVQRKRSMNRAL